MKKTTFARLLQVVVKNDKLNLINKAYVGGNIPVKQDKAILIFLWYMSKPDTLNSIAHQFHVVPSTVMRIVNVLLYILLQLKRTYICWPNTVEEYDQITQEFIPYPGVIGAIDGTHINLKVPMNQHDSYANRYLSHSINLMAISTARKIFTYVFIGYPGSAHDSRVFSNSLFSLNIQRHGPQIYFPHERYHLIGDSAFPLRTWLMTPYRKTNNMPRIQKHHNSCLSSNRVCIEHAFGLLKGRWRRLFFINTYSISKAIEIVTVACILHNFCYLCCDEWENENMHVEDDEIEYEEDHRDRDQLLLGTIKRNNIAQNLL